MRKKFLEFVMADTLAILTYSLETLMKPVATIIRLLILAVLLRASPVYAASSEYTVKKDTVLADNAVQPCWISWKSAILTNADLLYTDHENWNLWVMDENGGNKRCLTAYGNNILGVNFPLDDDGKEPRIHWKGAPVVYPGQPIIIFKAENEHSAHKPAANTPTIGWDNDFWALDLRDKQYYRLTNLKSGQGLQCAAISPDGKWFAYPLRYDKGNPRKDYGLSRMVFCELIPDARGRLQFVTRFEAEPNGQMYYEPNDIYRNASGSCSLLYAADPGKVSDPYVYEWTWDGEKHSGTSKQLQATPSEHEELFMFSPDGRKIAWMKGTLFAGRYLTDLYISNPDFSGIERITWYNDRKVWPDRYKPDGSQLSRLVWKNDGTAIFLGLWIHGGRLKPFNKTEIHRLDIVRSTDM